MVKKLLLVEILYEDRVRWIWLELLLFCVVVIAVEFHSLLLENGFLGGVHDNYFKLIFNLRYLWNHFLCVCYVSSSSYIFCLTFIFVSFLLFVGHEEYRCMLQCKRNLFHFPLHDTQTEYWNLHTSHFSCNNFPISNHAHAIKEFKVNLQQYFISLFDRDCCTLYVKALVLVHVLYSIKTIY